MVFWREEKRRFPRVKTKAPLSCQIRGTCDFNNTLSEDISLGGILMLNNKYIGTETLVNLKIKILSRVLSAVGKVAWFTPLPHSDKFRIGIEFVELDNLDKTYLSDYISMQTNKL